MDALDHVADAAADLLTRVESILVRAGAPAGHPVWPLLRRVRALPAEAVGAVVALRPAALTAAASALAPLAEAYQLTGESAARPVAWTGPAADAFAAQARALAATDRELARSVRATIGYAEAVTGWAAQSRGALAQTLATVLTSAEAVTVRTARATPEAIGAAAAIAARVLATVAEAYDRAEALHEEWAGRLVEHPEQPCSPDGPASGANTTVRL